MNPATHNQLLAALRNHKFVGPPSISLEHLEEAARANPADFHATLRRNSYNAADRQLRNPTPAGLSPLLEFYSAFRQRWHNDPHLDYFISYFTVLDAALRAGLNADAIANPRHTHIDEVVKIGRRAGEQFSDTFGGITGRRTILGQLVSLTDREAASIEFAPLRSEEAKNLVRAFYRDMGALTYYSADDLGPTAANDAMSVKTSIEPVRVRATRNRVGIAVSVDPHFFRIYGAWLYFYAQQIPSVDINVFICASPRGTADLVEVGDRFSSTLGDLNMAGTPQNINFYRVPTPTFVADKKTFFACARFFAADLLLEQYENIYFMDVDLRVDENPLSFFKSLQHVPISAPETRIGVGLSPWRRYMAGNIAVSRDIYRSSVLNDFQVYMAHGLREEGSWMLDQNALAFAIESDNTGVFQPLNDFQRPFYGSKFMATWEANYRQAAKRNKIVRHSPKN